MKPIPIYMYFGGKVIQIGNCVPNGTIEIDPPMSVVDDFIKTLEKQFS